MKVRLTGMVAALLFLVGCGDASTASKPSIPTIPSVSATAAPLPAATSAVEQPSSVSSTASGAVATTTTKPLSPKDAQLAFARCMRAEGVDVPDPDGSGNFGSIPTGPSVDEALKTCQQILQGTNGGGAQITPEIKKQFLDLAKCIRANGFPDFPDPGITGNAVKLGGGGENLDPNDPKVKAALDLCSKKVNLNLGRPQ